MAIAVEDIVDRESFEEWLDGQPREVARLLSMRIALRIWPKVFSALSNTGQTGEIWQSLVLNSFRATFIAWAAGKYSIHGMHKTAEHACFAIRQIDATADSIVKTAISSNFQPPDISRITATRSAAQVAALCAACTIYPARVSAAVTAEAAAETATLDGTLTIVDPSAGYTVWEFIRQDAERVLEEGQMIVAAPLWPNFETQVANPILQIDAQNQIAKFQQTEEYTALPWGLWVAWWENLQDDTSKSLFGEKADLEIALKDDVFWDRDVDVVMAELAAIVGWPWEDLPQDPRAAEMVVNAEGQIDAKESEPADLLLDTPQQREEYKDLRADAAELLDFGQQLGKLQSELEKFLDELPADFTAARVRPLWRAGNRLRRTLKTHQALEDYPDPHTARLDPEIAQELTYLLESYNNFSFADPGLRRRDERKISPQERASLEAERKQAEPLIANLLAADLLTDAAKQELELETNRDDSHEDTANDNVYDEQLKELEIRQDRNILAAAITGARAILKTTGGALGNESKHASRKMTDGAYQAAGATIGTLIVGGTALTAYQQGLLNFIVEKSVALKAYALTAYPGSYAEQIIDAILRLIT